MWSPPNPPPLLSLLTGAHPPESLTVTTFFFFNHPGLQAESLCDSPVTDDEPAGIKLLLPEINCFHFDKFWQRHCLPL